MGLAGYFTPAWLSPPVAPADGRGTKAYVEKGQKSSDIGAIMLSFDYCWLAGSLLIPHIWFLRGPCKEFLKSSFVGLAGLGFQALEPMVQWPSLPCLKIMALIAAVAVTPTEKPDDIRLDSPQMTAK